MIPWSSRPRYPACGSRAKSRMSHFLYGTLWRYIPAGWWHITYRIPHFSGCSMLTGFEGREGVPMGWYSRSRLKALPILNPGISPVKCIISRLICISEPAIQADAAMVTIETALDRLSDAELDEYTRPENLTSVVEAIDYMDKRKAESSEYLWKRQADYLFLLATSEFARSKGVAGVAFEFLTRTGPALWTVHQVPDPCGLLGHPAHYERNELVGYSRRLWKSPVNCRQDSSGHRLYRVGHFADRVAASPLT